MTRKRISCFLALAVFVCPPLFYGCIFGASDDNKGKSPSLSGMILIPSKNHSFQMGANNVAAPVHQVSFTYDFYMDTIEVTQGDYQTLVGVNPSYFKSSLRPVERITWFDAILYCNKRSLREGLDTVYRYSAIFGIAGDGVDSMNGLSRDDSKKGYRLPTEAEWEYAYRGGTQTAFYWGNSEDSTDAYAWYSTNAGDSTRPVGLKKPNSFGLHDMAGNVYECIYDWYGEYDSLPQIDPKGPDTGSFHALRSGCWFNVPSVLTAGHRGKEPADDRNLDVGFRCVITR